MFVKPLRMITESVRKSVRQWNIEKNLRLPRKSEALCLQLVPGRGLEPPQPCDYQNLNLARLPFPPPGQP